MGMKTNRSDQFGRNEVEARKLFGSEHERSTILLKEGVWIARSGYKPTVADAKMYLFGGRGGIGVSRLQIVTIKEVVK